MKEKTFGERLARLREDKGWLQRDLAFRVSVKANTISNWEKGISRPNLDQLRLLCQALSVPSDTLLGLDKTGMERTLNLKEQRILAAFRNANPEMQSAMYQMLAHIDSMNSVLYEKNASLALAEQFIENSGMQGEWKEAQRKAMPSDQ